MIITENEKFLQYLYANRLIDIHHSDYLDFDLQTGRSYSCLTNKNDYRMNSLPNNLNFCDKQIALENYIQHNCRKRGVIKGV